MGFLRFANFKLIFATFLEQTQRKELFLMFLVAIEH